MTLQASKAAPWPRVSVVMPALNEALNLPYVFARFPADIHEILVVDGHSTDDTVAVARQLRRDVRIVTQTRMGKGNALACGFAATTGDVIVMMDADGSTDPAEIPDFVTALLDGADFAKGTRFAPGAGSTDTTPLRSLGNRVFSLLVNICYGTRYSDLCYGFNAFWREHLQTFGLDAESPVLDDQFYGDGFEMQALLAIRAAEAELVIAEVPSFEHARVHGVGNLNVVRDGWRMLHAIMRERVAAKPCDVPDLGLATAPASAASCRVSAGRPQIT